MKKRPKVIRKLPTVIVWMSFFFFFFSSKALLGVCLEAWGTYLLSQDKPVEAGKLLTRALKVSKEVLGEEHEQVRVGTY